MSARLAFHLPDHLAARQPAEARGITRDAVRMMVAHRGTGELVHTTFSALPRFLDPGDLLVVNTSATIPGAVDARTSDGTRVVVHLSTHLADDRWTVELRCLSGDTTERWQGDPPDGLVHLGHGATLRLVGRYLGSSRLWVAHLSVPTAPLTWLTAHGRPIRYSYVDRQWQLAAYQNVYASEPGSAEMPSAGRPFTPEVITRLVSKGVAVTPVVLHTGVASLEADELPYPERVKVHGPTASRVNATRAGGGRVVAVGTTVVRALEAAAGPDGRVRPLDGWTDLVVTPERGVRVVDGMLTGWHEPEASHLMMLEAVAGRDLLEASHDASLAERYLWHEFGDVHLLLPSGPLYGVTIRRCSVRACASTPMLPSVSSSSRTTTATHSSSRSSSPTHQSGSS
ncbi:MAG: S-adenosylmethionine:tRNA ribosyltransferase-isomerase [Acidimicrobiia bacterium]|nr:S-adenosylmethionine:tRNA ribosyltransferase-isomerase [Acidimicrobiia bacterium]